MKSMGTGSNPTQLNFSEMIGIGRGSIDAAMASNQVSNLLLWICFGANQEK